METLEEQNFYVVQTEGSLHNETGPMSGTALIGHVQTRFAQDMPRAQALLAELEEKGSASGHFANSLGTETLMEIRRLPKKLTYGRGTNVPCRKCGRLIFPDGPIESEVRENEIWIRVECPSPACEAYQRPTWYPEVALEIHSGTGVK